MLQSLHDLFFFPMGRLHLLSSSSSPMASILLFFATTFVLLPQSGSAYDDNFTTCKAPFHCGNLSQELKYPFWGDSRPEYCGDPAFRLHCPPDEYPTIPILDNLFHIRDVNGSDQTMRISGMSTLSSNCSEMFNSTDLDDKHFVIAPGLSTILRIFFGCPPELLREYYPNSSFECDGSPEDTAFYLKKSKFLSFPSGKQLHLTNSCSHSVDVPIDNQYIVKLFAQEIELYEAIEKGFEVKYNTEVASNCSACEHSNGFCGTTTNLSSSDNQFVCFCPDEPHSLRCSVHDIGLGARNKMLIAVGVALALGMVLSLAVFILCCIWKPWNSASLLHGNNHRNIEAFIREYQVLASKRYNFSDVRKMTNSFKDKLGQGGYGSVYKGKLPDGRLVAVKLLNSAKGDGEEFINEVASISRTSHVNVVSLLGFCFQGSKRALIYEFMPNGSLEKYIRDDNSSVSDHRLGVELLYKIVIGIARGLGYLHRGCSTRILHFDIKPHNILLDEDFIPKISDFGLAKLCPPKESIVSMGVARGTIGYIAPEVFSRNFGGVSHKSDVYSYGMMILEMVGGKRNTNAGLSNSSDVYFPHWVYKRLELGEDVAFHGSMTVEENEIVKRMVLIGLWCIQTDPSLRPSMSKVLEMLEGTVETLLIPPKPFLSSSASLSPSISFTTSDVEILLK